MRDGFGLGAIRAIKTTENAEQINVGCMLMHGAILSCSTHLDGNLLSVLRVGAHAALQAVLLCVIHRVVPQVSTCLMEYLLLLPREER